MNERIKELRKALGLTLEKFGNKLGVGKTAVHKLEKGENNVTEQMIKSICREFDVNENWLRTGEGDMFIKSNRNMDIARLTKSLLLEESDSFKNRFISVLSNLSEDEWEILEKRMRQIYEGGLFKD